MRITINVNDLSKAQWEWLLRNVEQSWEPRAGEVRVCVTFETGDQSLIEHVHRELPVARFVGLVSALKRMTETAAAVLTPDALPAPGLDFSRIGTNSGHGHVWERPDGMRAKCGGRHLCDLCVADYALVVAQQDSAPYLTGGAS